MDSSENKHRPAERNAFPQNAHKKLQEAETDIEWAKKNGIKPSQY
jgi:hypothetical protein